MSDIEKNEHIHGDDCDCGCHDHDHNQTMTLVLEDDTELRCQVIGIFDAMDRQYIALLPEDDDAALIYRYNEKDNEEGFELENIETDEEFEQAENALFEILDDEDFDDEDFDDDEEYDIEDEED